MALFLKLPTDIHRLVLDYLELHDIYCLARTCRCMWSGAAYRDWNRELADAAVAKRFWKRVGLTMMREQWVCASCCRLHRVRAWSADPDVRSDPAIWDMVGVLTCSFAGKDDECRGEADVELALEYSLRDSARAIDLEVVEDTRRTAMSNGAWALAAVRSAPRVVGGKFVVRNSWEYRGNDDDDGTDLEAAVPLEMTVCPHIGRECEADRAWRPEQGCEAAAFEALAERALEAPGTEHMMNCGECLADCSIVVEPGTSKLSICTWADLTDGCSSPSSWIWGAEPLKVGDVRRSYEGV